MACAVVALAGLSGCFAKSAPDAGRMAATPAFPDESAWPARSVAALGALRDAVKPEELPLHVPLVIDAPAGLGESARAATPYAKEVREQIGTTVQGGVIAGNVLIREVTTVPLVRGSANISRFMRLREGKVSTEEQLLGFVPTARAVSSRTIEHPRNVEAREERAARRERINEALAKLGASYRLNPAIDDLLLQDGVALRVPLAVEAPDPVRGDSSWRGVVLHMHSLMGNSYERRVMDRLRRDGWLVVDISTQAFIAPQHEAGDAQLASAVRRLLHDRAHALDVRFAFQVETTPPGEMDIADFLLLASQTTERLDEYALRGDLNLRGLSPMSYALPARAFNRTKEVREFNKVKNFAVKNLEELEPAYLVARDADAAALEALGATIAHDVDQALAGNAYVVEGVVRWLDAERPDLRDKPVVIMGFSAGGLATPAAVARVRPILGDRLKAAVLIGSAGDLFRLSQESTLTDAGLKLRVQTTREAVTPDALLTARLAKRPKVDRATREALHASYLRHARLDPLKTARALDGLPVLMLHASFDAWVPARCGEELWVALGKPERWTIAGGHDLLFYFLPTQAEAIAAWLRARGEGPPGEVDF